MSQEAVVEKNEQVAEKCAHHWIIEAAGGPTSKGVCRRCGAEKEFLNYLENGPWDDDRPSYRVAGRRSSRAVVSDDPGDPSDES